MGLWWRLAMPDRSVSLAEHAGRGKLPAPGCHNWLSGWLCRGKESKDALMAAPPVPSCIVEGRLGGSAITVAAVNALASRTE